MKKVILFPSNKQSYDCISFWENAGYKKDKDFTVEYIDILMDYVIIPKVQMILAQDGIAFGFKIVEI